MKILIIEDESAIAEVEKAYIEREGYGAEIAGRPGGACQVPLRHF